MKKVLCGMQAMMLLRKGTGAAGIPWDNSRFCASCGNFLWKNYGFLTTYLLRIHRCYDKIHLSMRIKEM